MQDYEKAAQETCEKIREHKMAGTNVSRETTIGFFQSICDALQEDIECIREEMRLNGDD